MVKDAVSRCRLEPVARDRLADILGVYVACEDFLALGPEPKASAEMVVKDIEEAEAEEGVYRAIVQGDGTIIGVTSYVAGGFEGVEGRAFILLLMIVPDHRSAGIGSAVVKSIEHEINQTKAADHIHTAVQLNNPAARRFWERNGYQAVSSPERRPDGTTVVRLSKSIR